MLFISILSEDSTGNFFFPASQKHPVEFRVLKNVRKPSIFLLIIKKGNLSIIRSAAASIIMTKINHSKGWRGRWGLLRMKLDHYKFD